jgi:hypothetical protein
MKMHLRSRCGGLWGNLEKNMRSVLGIFKENCSSRPEGAITYESGWKRGRPVIGQRGDRVYRQKEQSLTNEKSLVSEGWEEGVQERREKECNGIIMKDDTLVDIAAQSAMAILAEIFSSYQSGRSPGGLLMIFLLHGPKMLSHSYS